PPAAASSAAAADRRAERCARPGAWALPGGEHDRAVRRLQPSGGAPPRRRVPALVPAGGTYHYLLHLRLYAPRRSHGSFRTVRGNLVPGVVSLVVPPEEAFPPKPREQAGHLPSRLGLHSRSLRLPPGVFGR